MFDSYRVFTLSARNSKNRQKKLHLFFVSHCMHQYSQTFLDYTSSANLTSASIIVNHLKNRIPIQSVVDFGCANGAWLSQWQAHGVTDIQGLDGHYVDKQRLLIDPGHFLAVDLNQPVRLNRRFDLVECLEVAEHVERHNASRLIESLISHADLILFSAAPPGQGGEHHINEQPYEYWRDLFHAHQFEPFDCIRPLILKNTRVNWWFRYNIFLYAHRDAISRLPEEWRKTHIPSTSSIPDLSPLLCKIRKGVIHCLPDLLENGLARLVAWHNSTKKNMKD